MGILEQVTDALLGGVRLRHEKARLKLGLLRDGIRLGTNILDAIAKSHAPPPPPPPSYAERHECIRREDIRAVVKSVIEEHTRESYVPEEPSRTVSGSEICYATMTRELVGPGQTATLSVGITTPIEGTGWPGLPETQRCQFGAAENLQPTRITISPEFGLVGFFVGSANTFPCAPSSDICVPATHLLSHPQPKYPMWGEGIPTTVIVKNLGKRALPCRVTITGHEVVEEAKKPEHASLNLEDQNLSDNEKESAQNDGLPLGNMVTP